MFVTLLLHHFKDFMYKKQRWSKTDQGCVYACTLYPTYMYCIWASIRNFALTVEASHFNQLHSLQLFTFDKEANVALHISYGVVTMLTSNRGSATILGKNHPTFWKFPIAITPYNLYCARSTIAFVLSSVA